MRWNDARSAEGTHARATHRDSGTPRGPGQVPGRGPARHHSAPDGRRASGGSPHPGARRRRLAGRTSHRLERTPAEEDQAEGSPARRGQHGRHRKGEPAVTLLYLDTSALFKRYVEEAGSEALLGRIEDAPAVGTALITRVEVAAALAKAVRDDRMPSAEAREAESDFLDDWADFTRCWCRAVTCCCAHTVGSPGSRPVEFGQAGASAESSSAVRARTYSGSGPPDMLVPLHPRQHLFAL